jgi:hypothetical protein
MNLREQSFKTPISVKITSVVLFIVSASLLLLFIWKFEHEYNVPATVNPTKSSIGIRVNPALLNAIKDGEYSFYDLRAEKILSLKIENITIRKDSLFFIPARGENFGTHIKVIILKKVQIIKY